MDNATCPECSMLQIASSVRIQVITHSAEILKDTERHSTRIEYQCSKGHRWTQTIYPGLCNVVEMREYPAALFVADRPRRVDLLMV